MISSSFWVDMCDKANFSRGINAHVGRERPSPSSERSPDRLVRASALPLSFPSLKTILKSYWASSWAHLA